MLQARLRGFYRVPGEDPIKVGVIVDIHDDKFPFVVARGVRSTGFDIELFGIGPVSLSDEEGRTRLFAEQLNPLIGRKFRLGSIEATAFEQDVGLMLIVEMARRHSSNGSAGRIA